MKIVCGSLAMSLSVNNHVYDGTIFFRVIDDFVAQGGDPAQRHADFV
jgi:cyclophilin family peptidyl-prolyl cis-trans isomerase